MDYKYLKSNVMQTTKHCTLFKCAICMWSGLETNALLDKTFFLPILAHNSPIAVLYQFANNNNMHLCLSQ